LVGDQSMERFRNEYEKLHRALKTSYESEKRLVKRYGYISSFLVPFRDDHFSNDHWILNLNLIL